MEAVATHLLQRGVTRSSRLGIQGGSNGGLLMGNLLLRRPKLWSAVVCQVRDNEREREREETSAPASQLPPYLPASLADDIHLDYPEVNNF